MLFKRFAASLNIRSLRGRLQFGFLTFFIIVAIITTTFFYIVEKKNRFDTANNEVDKLIKSQQIVVDNWLDEKLYHIKMISQLGAFQVENYEKMSDVLNNFIKTHKEFYGISFANTDGITKVGTGSNESTNVSQEPFFINALKGEVYISDVIINELSNDPVIVISVPVYSEYNELSGILYGSVPTAKINKILAKFQI